MSESIKPATVAGHGRDSAFVDIYSNQIRMNVSVADVAITFSVLDDFAQQGNFIKDQAAVRLSPGTAKVLALQLSSAISAYESSCGTIPISSSATRAIKEIESGLKNALKSQIND